MKLFAKKPIEVILAEGVDESEYSLKRGLGPIGLTSLGIGSIIGAGIFVLTGQAAATHAGPAIVISFIIAGVVCALAALCYAELASMIPVAGSAYTYTYATMGEFIAWIIAWDLIIEYLFAASTVSAGWSGYFQGMLELANIHIPAVWAQAPYKAGEGFHLVATGAILNVPAVAIIFLMALVLIAGITESAAVNNVIVAIKVGIVVLVIVAGFMFVKTANWSPLIPPETVDAATGVHKYGLGGIFAAAGLIFFAYIGFETVSTAGQEAKNPQRNMPIGILAALGICTVLYILMSLVITGLAPYGELNTPRPVFTAIDLVRDANGGKPLAWLGPFVTIGATIGLGSTILTLLYGQSRIFYAMARDGLLPKAFASVGKNRKTPWVGTLITAAFAALMGGLFPIGILGELVSMGTLLAFALICAGVVYLRIKHPELKRTFKTPLWYITAPLGSIACLYLIFSLPAATWLRLVIWMAVGLVVYFGYAYWHSRYHEKQVTAPTPAE